MEAVEPKEQRFMTVDFSFMLLKYNWLAILVVAAVFVSILLLSDQYTRTTVRLEGMVAAKAIEETAKLKGEFEAYVKRNDLERVEIKEALKAKRN
jgi:cell division protein FtsL